MALRTLFTVILILAAADAAAQGPARVGVPADSTSLPSIIAAPDAEPGSVVSVAVRIPSHEGLELAEYQVRPGTKVMLYGRNRGQIEWNTTEAILPLTFSVPKTEAAGVMHIAQVLVRWADGTQWVADVQSRVGVRRMLELTLNTNSALIERGGSAAMTFTLANLGNAADTVALTFQAPSRWQMIAPEAHVLAPGESVTDTLRVRAPGDAFLGETQILALTANGQGSATTASAAFEVASATAPDATWIRLPATLVVGLADATQLHNSPFAFGLEASGPLGYALEGSISARYTGSTNTAPAFHRYLAGPSLRAEIKRGSDRITAGDVLLGGSPLLGHYMQGSGVDADATFGTVRTSLHVSRPFALDAPVRDGHLVRAEGTVALGGGTLTTTLADLDRPYGIGISTERTQLATGLYRIGGQQGHSGSVEFGLMRLRDSDGNERSGPVMDAGYRFRDDRFDVGARLRRVPGSIATGGSAVDQTFVSAAALLGRRLSANAWALRDDVDMLDGSSTRRDGAAVALRWRNGLSAAQLSANVGANKGSGLISGDSRRRSVSLGGNTRLGALMIDGTIEMGSIETRDYDEPLRSAAARLSYQHGSAWLWLGATHSSGVFGTDMQRLDLGGTVRTRGFEIDGGAGTYVGSGSIAENLNAWLSTTLHVDAGSSVILGMDYMPWSDGSGVRISLGGRRAFGLPLPIRRHAVVEGTLYDDRNGNLQRDTSEPPLPGVVLRRGAMYTTSDERGRFAFYDDARVTDDMRIDPSSLEAGLLIPPGARLPAAGRVDIPLHRAGSLRLALFNDADSDGVRDAAESVARRATVEIVDEHGRTRTAAADDNGSVELRALSPGRYTIRAFAAEPQRAAPARTIEVTVEPAAHVSVDVPVPFKAVEIRFKTGN